MDKEESDQKGVSLLYWWDGRILEVERLRNQGKSKAGDCAQWQEEQDDEINVANLTSNGNTYSSWVLSAWESFMERRRDNGQRVAWNPKMGGGEEKKRPETLARVWIGGAFGEKLSEV